MHLKSQDEQAPGFSIDVILQCLLNETGDGIIGLDCSGKIRTWNPSAQRIYGYTCSEITGTKINVLFASENEGNEWTVAVEKLSPGAPVRGWERRHIHKNGSAVHVSVDLFPLVSDDGSTTGTCISVRETQKYRMLESQLRQTQKLEAVGRLSGGIAHDFNNLLTIITGYNEMIRLEHVVGSDTREWSEQVSKAADMATKLTNQLLAFSRREVTLPRVLNLNEIVQDLEKMLRRIAGEDVGMVLALDPTLGNIKADPGQISQLLTNLVANSRDALSGGGEC
jgi:two-component system cell cycle sensor histidine kinase/response regulator CckA